jgi:hypothetical protein
MSRASAPANPSSAEFAFHSDFFSSLFSRAEKGQRVFFPSAGHVKEFTQELSVHKKTSAIATPIRRATGREPAINDVL